MTIILSIPVKDGIIFASDSQITSGLIRSTGKKIKKLNKGCLYGASGEIGLIQYVEDGIFKFSDRERPLQDLSFNLVRIIRDRVVIFCELIGNRPIDADFLFVEYLFSEPHILHIALDGTPEWIENRPFVSGIRPEVSTALFHKYLNIIPNKIDIEKGKLLAYKIIEEVIEVISYGVGPPIDIWQITTGGIKNLDEQELLQLQDLSCGLREAEINLFLESKG